GEDGLLDDGGAATQAVEAEQRVGQEAGAAGGGAGEAAELGGDAERGDTEIGDHGDDADSEAGDSAGPALDEDAPENGGKRRRWHGGDRLRPRELEDDEGEEGQRGEADDERAGIAETMRQPDRRPVGD